MIQFSLTNIASRQNVDVRSSYCNLSIKKKSNVPVVCLKIALIQTS